MEGKKDVRMVKFQFSNWALAEKNLEKNGHHLPCDLHNLGATLCIKLPVAPLSCKKSVSLVGWMNGWMDGWMDGGMDGGMVKPG